MDQLSVDGITPVYKQISGQVFITLKQGYEIRLANEPVLGVILSVLS